MNDDQIKFAMELDRQRSDFVRALRKTADIFSDEMSGPKAVAISWIYRAAADLLNNLTFVHFAEVAKEAEQGREARP